MTVRGTLCRTPRVGGFERCLWHEPALAERAAAARKLGGEKRRRPKPEAAFKSAAFGTIDDAVEMIRLAVNDVLAAEPSIDRSLFLMNSAKALRDILDA